MAPPQKKLKGLPMHAMVPLYLRIQASLNLRHGAIRALLFVIMRSVQGWGWKNEGICVQSEWSWERLWRWSGTRFPKS
jgi:hypothetical protein